MHAQVLSKSINKQEIGDHNFKWQATLEDSTIDLLYMLSLL
jgi:hypothetical protein